MTARPAHGLQQLVDHVPVKGAGLITSRCGVSARRRAAEQRPAPRLSSADPSLRLGLTTRPELAPAR
jgi:hypothetical protein